MSEEILKALMQLFALIVKQDGGMLTNEREYVENFLSKQLSHDSVTEYLELFDSNAGPVLEKTQEEENEPPSVKDSVKIFSICKKINRTLNQTQKVVVLMRLYELINADARYTLQRMNIINTVSEVFKISSSEFKSIEDFVKHEGDSEPEDKTMLLIKHETQCIDCEEGSDEVDQNIILVLWISSVDLYFIKHFSNNQLFLNGLPLLTGKVYTVAQGSSLRYPQGLPIYYSDLSSHFLAQKKYSKISLVTEDLSFHFPGDKIGINSINLSETEGNLVGIMGSSGTGKTTLLNLLSGILTPSFGSVRINGFDIHDNKDEIEGVIGYVPQDDLLIADLSVFENLFYASSLCFKDKSKEEIIAEVDKTLMNLGLYEKRNLKVGSPLNKIISGGQRKRLNIALELIREPSILFLDEPTSGLSSRDSENVMDLLRELTFKGKLVFAVIHQPSSEIFKMFAKMLILDQGGEMIYYGNPLESLIHFKTLDNQIDSNISECPSCGNINPETIFNIIETEVVDEFGRYTGNRKTQPSEWAEGFFRLFPQKALKEVREKPPSNLKRPGVLKQFYIFAIRDLKSKMANRQYLLLTLLEAPVLGFILSYIIRYKADPSSREYIFMENENISIYIFMSLIVALFLGLITSAEEIFKDARILRREQFLHLSRGSYLFSKITILFLISALQAILFVAIANPILGIKGLTFQYWLALFTTAAFANILGLNISAAFNSAITIYIVIPMLMIPMMVLSGAMFSFDKLNRTIGSVDKVPVIADIMPTKWTYEALMVSQFKDNKFDRLVYDWDKQKSIAQFNITYRLPKLRDALNLTNLAYENKQLSIDNPARLPLLKNELLKYSSTDRLPEFPYLEKLNPADFNHFIAEAAHNYIEEINKIYNRFLNSADNMKDSFVSNNLEELYSFKNDHHNTMLNEIGRKFYEKNKILEYKDNLVQNWELIYLDPPIEGLFNFRSHFLAPTKTAFGGRFDTFNFNIAVVWLMAISLFFLLYFDLFHRIVNVFERK